MSDLKILDIICDSYNSKSIAETTEYISESNIENFDESKIDFYKKDFITENSKEITFDHILFTLKNIKRSKYIVKLSELLYDLRTSQLIEHSIFEFSLIHIISNHLDNNLILPVYEDKFNDIFDNLDDNSRFQNKTLKHAVMNGSINPKLIAFLPPDQLHPENWASLLNKIRFKQEAENNMASTDVYKCRKCGERKCKITELQLRSADEPSSKFITCLICYNTFII